MKKLILTLAVFTCVFALAEENIPGPDGVIRNPDGSLKRFSKAEFMKLPLKVRQAMGREFFRITFGPKVEKPNSAKGFFKYINSSKLVSIDDLQDAIKPINRYSLIRLVATEGASVDPSQAKAGLGAAKAEAGVFIVDSDSLPRIILAPEDGWAIVNAQALNLDNPDRATLIKRVNIELVRAFTYICGSANDHRSVIMAPVSSLSDLDKIPSARFLPTNIEQMGKQLENFGIQPRVIKHYKAACEEGWAHMPTNAVERGIWEKVHSIPSNPMKIKYKGKK